LQSHPEIDDAVVLGVAHDELGQEVKAVIVVRPGAHLDAAAVQAWAGATLAPFKVPAQIEFRDALPRNATGKVLKHLLDPGAVTPFAGEE
jgi:acyl-CoA synthetase (AMP-forming)/AMP-acid ligase II